ncbi:hypothetical protein K443DRAFT_27410, partial [Laccaria amethystina LaAM-08-1]
PPSLNKWFLPLSTNGLLPPWSNGLPCVRWNSLLLSSTNGVLPPMNDLLLSSTNGLPPLTDGFLPPLMNGVPPP